MPRAEPEITTLPRRKRPFAQVSMRIMDLFCLDGDGHRRRWTVGGRVSPCSIWLGDGQYQIEWRGQAIVCHARRVGRKIGVQLIGAAGMPFTMTMAEFEAVVLGKVAGESMGQEFWRLVDGEAQRSKRRSVA